MVRLDAQIRVRVTRVRLTDDETLDHHWLLLIVVRGECSLVKVRLREVVAKRAQQRGLGALRQMMTPSIATPAARPGAIAGNAMRDASQMPMSQARVNGTSGIIEFQAMKDER